MPRVATTQGAVGAGVLLVGLALAGGATTISSEAGYSGVGPNFLPWLVALFLCACGAFLLREACTGGFRDSDQPEGSEHGHWPGFVWISAGLLLNAALITRIGFILSCALCFVFAVQGFKSAEGVGTLRIKGWLLNTAIGIAIAAPVYWMFSQLLAINLPGLTSTGWL